MSYTKVFYWLVVADNAKTLFGWFGIFSLIVAIAWSISIADEDIRKGFKDNPSQIPKFSRWIWSLAILFIGLWVFTPSKKDALLIVAGGNTLDFLSTDSSAKKLPSELTSFVLTELKAMAKDAEVELGVQNQKDKILDEAKKLTTDELLDKMKTDTSYRAIIMSELK